VAILFVIGGFVGLIVNAIYRKGRRDAASSPPGQVPPEPPQGPPF
jgi:hypothetical protein